MEKIERLYLIVFFLFFLGGEHNDLKKTRLPLFFVFLGGAKRHSAFERSLSSLSSLRLLCVVSPELLSRSLAFSLFSAVCGLFGLVKTIKQFILLFFLLSFHYPLLTFSPLLSLLSISRAHSLRTRKRHPESRIITLFITHAHFY
jgi:hypothetical protein